VQDKLTTAQNNLASAKQSSEQQIANLQDQITQLGAERNNDVTSSDQYVALMDQLNETKLKFALFSWWQVGPEGAFKDPQNKNKFYFTKNHRESSTVTVSSVLVYDFTKDESFQKNGTVDVLNGSTYLTEERLPAESEFRSVGITDRKFVFTQTHFENSPGPCFTPWLYDKLYYVDLDAVEEQVKKDYTLSDEQKIAETKKVEDCQNSL
jgi:hypothetical protein